MLRPNESKFWKDLDSAYESYPRYFPKIFLRF